MQVMIRQIHALLRRNRRSVIGLSIGLVVLAGLKVDVVKPAMAESVVVDETALAAAFQTAAASTVGRSGDVTYEIGNCVLTRTRVNVGYCESLGQGEGDRIIKTVLDLREIEHIRSGMVRGKFYVDFDLDFGGPGTFFILRDRVVNGSEGNFERFMARKDAVLKAAEMSSHTSYSRCDGTVSKEPNSASITLFTGYEPEGWHGLIDLAKECRAPNVLRVSENSPTDPTQSDTPKE